VDKRFLYFKDKEDAKKRFPRSKKLALGFFGINGWLWTTEAIAKKKAGGYKVEGR